MTSGLDAVMSELRELGKISGDTGLAGRLLSHPESLPARALGSIARALNGRLHRMDRPAARAWDPSCLRFAAVLMLAAAGCADPRPSPARYLRLPPLWSLSTRCPTLRRWFSPR